MFLKRKHLLGDFSDEQNEQAENSKMDNKEGAGAKEQLLTFKEEFGILENMVIDNIESDDQICWFCPNKI